MVLTSEQVQALKEGEPVTLSPPEVGEECVLLRADVFSSGSASWCWIPRKLKSRDAYPAILRAWDSVGSPDDGEPYRT